MWPIFFYNMISSKDSLTEKAELNKQKYQKPQEGSLKGEVCQQCKGNISLVCTWWSGIIRKVMFLWGVSIEGIELVARHCSKNSPLKHRISRSGRGASPCMTKYLSFHQTYSAAVMTTDSESFTKWKRMFVKKMQTFSFLLELNFLSCSTVSGRWIL